MKRQSIYQNNLYNTNDTADLGLYGSQWKAQKISFWMCTVPDGAQWTRVEEIVRLIPTMKTIGGVKSENGVSSKEVSTPNSEPEKIDFSTLDDGERKDRVILSGIHEYYEPEELVGKTAIAIVNLPPRKMMGIDSEGMLISAVHEEDGHEGLNLLMVDDRIPAGAKLY